MESPKIGQALTGEKATSASLCRRMTRTVSPSPSSTIQRFELREILLLIQGRPSISEK